MTSTNYPPFQSITKKLIRIEIFMHLVRISCFLGMQELAFRGHREKENVDNKGNYCILNYFIP